MDGGWQMAFVHTYFHLLETTFSVCQKTLIMVSAHTYLHLQNNSAAFLMASFHLQNELIKLRTKMYFPTNAEEFYKVLSTHT